VSAIEQLESRSVAYSDGRRTGTRVWIVDNGTPSLALADGDLPVFGASDFPNEPTLFYTGWTASRVPGHSNQCEVVTNYTTSENFEVGSTKERCRTYSEFDEWFRSYPGLSVPAAGSISNDNTSDIAGTKADVAGHPTSLQRLKSDIVIEETINRTDLSLTTYASLTGKRNSGTFLSFAAGQLVYLGADVVADMQDARVQVAHTFRADNYYHLVQIPARDVAGNVVLDGASPYPRAAAVYWRQPFPETGNFATISPNF
jgi:hypothetical protein